MLFFEFFFDLIISPSIENSSVLIAAVAADSSPNCSQLSPHPSNILIRFRLALLKYQVLHYFLELISNLDGESAKNLSRPDFMFKCFIDSAVAQESIFINFFCIVPEYTTILFSRVAFSSLCLLEYT